MSDERQRHPSPGAGRVAPPQFDSAAPWAPAASGSFETPPALGAAAVPAVSADVVPAEVYVAALPALGADVVPAEVYEVRPASQPGVAATAIMPEPPAFVARIPTSLPPFAAAVPPPFEPPVAALGLPPRRGHRRLRLVVTAAVVLCALGAIVVGYTALTRTADPTRAQAPAFPGAPPSDGSFPGGPSAAAPAPPLTVSAGPSATAPGKATATTAAATTAPATTAADSGATESAVPVAGATPESSPLVLRPPPLPPTTPAGSLEATLTYRAGSTGDGGVTRYNGTIVLDNSEASDVSSWSVTLTVPGGNAVLARGPVAVDQSGESVEFTPAAGGVVPAGGSLTFSFSVRGVLSDLPGDCAVNGRACS
jgi:hypothetical protein